MDKNTLITVTAVMKDAEPIVSDFLSDMTALLNGHFEHYEIVLVDNCSSDESVAVVRECMQVHDHIRLVVLSREYEEQVALTAALENSIGDFVVIMDMNTDPPDLVPRIVQKAAEGFDIVTGEIIGKRQTSFLYASLSRAFYRLSNLISESKIDLNWSNFVCFSRKTVNSILQIKDRVRYLKYLQTEIGYSRETIKYEQINRSGSYRSTSFWSRFFFAMETLVSNSERLIRIATSLALLTSIGSMGYFLYALFVTLLMTNVAEGWTSTSMVLSVMFAVMFFILFIIGEYIALVYKETRKGPLYHVADEFNSSVLFQKIREKNVI